jgi:RNA polymerase sigma-70 factor (ECF subfamily)
VANPPNVSVTQRPSLAELFGAHAAFVWQVLASHNVPAADVKDATQEVFLVAHRRMHDWDPERASPRTWLHAIATHIAANHRKRARHRHEGIGEADEQPVEADPGDALDGHRAVKRFYAVLEQLPEEHREIVKLFELNGLSMKEVADVIGCSVRTAYNRLSEAKAEIKRALEQRPGRDL